MHSESDLSQYQASPKELVRRETQADLMVKLHDLGKILEHLEAVREYLSSLRELDPDSYAVHHDIANETFLGLIVADLTAWAKEIEGEVEG